MSENPSESAPPDQVEPQLAQLLERLVCGREARTVSERLAAQALAHLDQVAPVNCIGGPVQALAQRTGDTGKGEIATTLKLLRAVSGTVGPQMQEPPVAAVTILKEHERIASHSVTVLVESEDPCAIAAALRQAAPGFDGWEVADRRFTPRRCGLLRLGQAQGLFVELAACQDACRPNTFLAFDTREDPVGRRVEWDRHAFTTFELEGHTLYLWRGARDGWLYVLVTHCAHKNSLALAELLRAG